MIKNKKQLKKACVVGDPIAHSLSPLLHNTWIKTLAINAVYESKHVKSDMFFQSTKDLFANSDFVGMNITLPHKGAALKRADIASEEAQLAGAANLLVRKGGQLYADNTDIAGFCSPLLESRRPAEWKNKKIVIIGAGGAARAALIGALKLNPGAIILVNRTDERAKTLADQFGHQVKAVSWSKREDALLNVALLVNASAAGMRGADPLDISLRRLETDALVYDLIYTPLKTNLLLEAERKGLLVLGGLDMLIAQARPSFEAFFGRPPPRDNAVKRVLLKALGENA